MSISSFWIFMAVLAFFGLIQIIQKNSLKDKTNSESSSPKSQPLPEAWKDIISTEETKVRPTPHHHIEIRKKTESTIFIEDAKEEGKSAVASAPFSADKEEANSEDYSFNSIDDVRKAIIWSEIIKRKY